MNDMGVIVPSVSEILHFLFPDKYKNVSANILSKKAEYGTIIHESIECLENGKTLPKLDKTQEFSINQYLRLKSKFNIEVIAQEQMINYNDVYAGRFDMIAKVSDDLSLCDIKTTAILDKEYLSWQLSFYELAQMSMYHIKPFDKLYAIWLPKKKYGELVEVERKPIVELLRVLKEFKTFKERNDEIDIN